MILSGKTIRNREIIFPHEKRTEHYSGLTYGESSAGYDIRLGEDVRLHKRALAVSLERFLLPLNVVGRVCDKSSWARHFVFVQNTVIEPGWIGYLTLELTSETDRVLQIPAGTPIAQVLFEETDEECDGYCGTYQRQLRKPCESKLNIEKFVVKVRLDGGI